MITASFDGFTPAEMGEWYGTYHGMQEKFISRFILGCFGGKAKVGKGSNLDNFGRTKCEDKRKEASQVQFPPWSASLARAAPDQLSLSYLPSKSLSVRDSLLSVSIPGSECVYTRVWVPAIAARPWARNSMCLCGRDWGNSREWNAVAALGMCICVCLCMSQGSAPAVAVRLQPQRLLCPGDSN